MIALLQGIAVLGCALFAGAAIYINVAEHPARLECGTELAATVFGPSYRRASIMQAGLAAISGLSGIALWGLTGGAYWGAGALLILFVIPFTFIAIMPTNKQLLDPSLDRTAEATRELLLKWGRLHGVRSIAGLAASVVYFVQLV